MESRKQVNNQPELRFCTGAEARVVVANEGTRTIRGYSIVFNKKSVPLTMKSGGRFVEIIAPEAVKGVEFSRNISLFNHNINIPLASVESRTMRVGVDSVGVWYEADLPKSPNGDNVWEDVRRGVVRGSSFQFNTAKGGDTWEQRDGMLYRTVTQFSDVFEMGPVVDPAYPDTTAAQHSYEQRFASLGDENRASDKWDISWMISSSAYATGNGNDMIIYLNGIIERYEEGDYTELGIDPQLKSIVEDAKVAKSALVKIISTFSDVIKVLNESEKRASGDIIKTQQARKASIEAALALHS